MNKLFFSILTAGLILPTCLLHAVILDKLPGPPGMPMTQGSMLHINILFTDSFTNTFEITLDPGVPLIQPLSAWSPGNTLDPMDPWYSALDPAQDAAWFSGRYGFLLDVGGSDELPEGNSIGIRVLSGSPGLETYFYRFTDPKTFESVLEPAHDYVLWSGVMWHPVFVIPANTSYGSTVTANFEVFLADKLNDGFVDYNTSALPVPGYDTGSFSLTWTAIPEPSSTLLLLAGAGLIAWKKHRQN